MHATLRVLLIALLLACRCRATEPRQLTGRSDWTGKAVAKVVEYRFKGPDLEPVSLISEKGLDARHLKKYSVKSTQLSPTQIAALLDATFSTTHRVATAACYDPHHIFVFYSKNGRPLRAIEVCFECTTVVTAPQLGDKFETHHDFVALARLTAELGLWPEGETVDEFATLMKAREPSEE